MLKVQSVILIISTFQYAAWVQTGL